MNKTRPMIHHQVIDGVPLDFKYTYETHSGKKIPKIVSIEFKGYVLTEIINHSLVEDVRSCIFMVLNKDIYNN